MFTLYVMAVMLSLIQGSRAEDTFVLKGEDFHFKIPQSVQLNPEGEIGWRFNHSKTIVKFHFNDSSTPKGRGTFLNRIDFSKEDFSLLLRDLSEADSGLYSAVHDGEDNKRVAEYNIVVLDRASQVKLTVTAVSPTPESCNLTVSCSTEKFPVTGDFRCDYNNETQNCSQMGTNSSSGLHVFLSDGYIICNHSNQVSWNNDTKAIDSVCRAQSPGEINLLLILCILILLIIACPPIIGVWLYLKLKKHRTSDRTGVRGNTTYATVQLKDGANQGNPDLTFMPMVNTIYDTARLPATSSEVGPEAANNGSPKVESVYTRIEKPVGGLGQL